MSHTSSQPFYDAYRGSFRGLRRWSDLDTLWKTLGGKADQNWYIYAIGEAVPDSPVTAKQLDLFIDEINTLLHNEHKEEYCGIVYVDDTTDPAFIKIYDPNNLGVTCGFSDSPPLPGWIISKLPPLELSQSTFLPQNRRRWWRRLFTP